MNKNYTIDAVVIIVVVLLTAIFMSKNTKEVEAPINIPAQDVDTAKISPSPSPNASSSPSGTPDTAKVTVIYTTSGFSPKNITVKKGEVVEFINQSGKNMSVASDPHPTHTVYPEFDQYKTNYRGQNSFLFTFGKVGSWKYHDHIQSALTGTVVVTD